VNIEPDAETLRKCIGTAKFVTRLGVEPRVAMLSFSNFVGEERCAAKCSAPSRCCTNASPNSVDGEMQVTLRCGAHPDAGTRSPGCVDQQRLIFPDLDAANTLMLLARLGDAQPSAPSCDDQPVHVLQVVGSTGHREHGGDCRRTL
jgi:malate dehydrogenase (oxaloacetate-decarboxylating)(NADP+)